MGGKSAQPGQSVVRLFNDHSDAVARKPVRDDVVVEHRLHKCRGVKREGLQPNPKSSNWADFDQSQRPD